MISRESRTVTTMIASSLLILAGCGGSPNVEETGFISLGISDGPVHDAKKICITFDWVEFKPVDGGRPFTIDLDSPEKVNLLDYQGANAAPMLVLEEVPAGAYEWVRLGVDANLGSSGGVGDTGGDACDGDASYIVTDVNTVYNLYVPSGEQSGLKLVDGFTVPVDGTIDVTADWDLMQSITAPLGLDPDVILKPTIRLVNNEEAGTLAGLVSNELATAPGCDPSVYVFNNDVTPNAITTDADDDKDPVATAMVNDQQNNDGTTTHHYEIGFLPAENYEAAFTCDGEVFEPADGKPAKISAQQVTTVDFP